MSRDRQIALARWNPVNTSKVHITEGNPKTDHWLSGRVADHPEYRFTAKIYDAGSKFGISDGRISKLEVFYQGRAVISYSRGWSQPPETREQHAVLKTILAGVPEKEKIHHKILSKAESARRAKARKQSRSRDEGRDR